MKYEEIEYVEYEKKLRKQLTELKESNNPVVIFGTLIASRIAKTTLDFLNVNPVCYCDNNREKQGKKIGDITVLSLEEVKKKYPNSNICICSFNGENEKKIKTQLEAIGFRNIFKNDVLYWAYITQVIKRPISSLSITKSLIELKRPDSLILQNVLLMLTEKCNLRCNECVTLTTHYNQPQNYDKFEIIESVKMLSKSVDVIKQISLFGGEPLLHPDLVEICNELAKIENLLQISIITNGTIIPSKEFLNVAKNTGTYFCFSDYGETSNKSQELLSVLQNNQSLYEYIIEIEPNWFKLNLPQKHNRSSCENRKMFNECFCGTKLKHSAVQRGKWFYCGIFASFTNLKLIPDFKDEYIDLLDNNISIEDKRKHFDKIINNTDFLSVCDHCDFNDKIVIPRAKQME